VDLGATRRQRNAGVLPFLAHLNQADLAVLCEFVAAGKVVPVIDRTCPLSEAAEAIGYLGQGHARGKVVVTV
jgi:NADPH:quinone reductase-like Zn-dependent oxidoreductase